jgi:hypothetical protein
MTKDEALRLALETLQSGEKTQANGVVWIEYDCELIEEAITAIKAALEAKDEPVAYINVEQRKLEWAKYMSWHTPTVVNLPKIPLYTTPPQRTWVGLTDKDWNRSKHNYDFQKGVDWAESILKEKNNG